MPTAYVNSTVGLTEALADGAIGGIVIMPGTYQLDTANVCDGDSWLCVDRAMTIQAAEAGTVVLDARGQRRVFHITVTGVQLEGLNITGGNGSSLWNATANASRWGGNVVGGGLLIQGGETSLVSCNIFGCTAHTDEVDSTGRRKNGMGGGVFLDEGCNALLLGCSVHGNRADQGGGVKVEPGANATLIDCRVFGNVADYNGFGFGGGLRIDGGGTGVSWLVCDPAALKLGVGLS